MIYKTLKDWADEDIIDELDELIPFEMNYKAYEEITELKKELDRRGTTLECIKCGEKKQASEIVIGQGWCKECADEYTRLDNKYYPGDIPTEKINNIGENDG